MTDWEADKQEYRQRRDDALDACWIILIWFASALGIAVVKAMLE